MTLYLVRHGPPAVDSSRPAHAWVLDPSGYEDIRALADRLPSEAAWFCSPEPKAVETARLLTEQYVEVVPDLREHVRESGDWIDDFEAVVRRAFAVPEQPAHEGWEPLAVCEARVTGCVRAILGTAPPGDVVLVGHGTAWTVLVAALTGAQPDLDRWQAFGMPDVWVVEQPLGSNR